MTEGMKVRSVALAVFLVILLCALMLTGCSTPAAKDRIVEVSVPVAVRPITPAQIPALPAPLPKRPASLSAAADILLSKWCEAVGYFLRADPLLKISSGQQPALVEAYPECEAR